MVLLLHNETSMDYPEILVDYDEEYLVDVAIPKLCDFFHGCLLPELVEKRGKHALMAYQPWQLNEEHYLLYEESFLVERIPEAWNWPQRDENETAVFDTDE